MVLAQTHHVDGVEFRHDGGGDSAQLVARHGRRPGGARRPGGCESHEERTDDHGEWAPLAGKTRKGRRHVFSLSIPAGTRKSLTLRRRMQGASAARCGKAFMMVRRSILWTVAVALAVASGLAADRDELLWPVPLEPGVSSSFCDYRDG